MISHELRTPLTSVRFFFRTPVHGSFG
ncbi:MAG: hypothetical protein K2Y39_14915 [Candidatus Obscuribacterales bacterium]|nr:hypothetical protein [Candidatus Obscuribacterales bacterium]